MIFKPSGTPGQQEKDSRCGRLKARPLRSWRVVRSGYLAGRVGGEYAK